jgi:hypothetical protein
MVRHLRVEFAGRVKRQVPPIAWVAPGNPGGGSSENPGAIWDRDASTTASLRVWLSRTGVEQVISGG